MYDIFISHNSKDKNLVEPLAIKLAEIYGMDRVFYDSWSIQPGESIIGKMNEGLEQSMFFFYFVSKNSLASNMVNLEWQSALMKSANKNCRFIAIKLDDCNIPQIITQNKYLDLCNYGIDVVLSQMIQIIQGKEVGGELVDSFSNVICEINVVSKKEIDFSFKALHFQEPISRYMLLFRNKPEDIDVGVMSDSFFSSSFSKNVVYMGNGKEVNGFGISVSRATTPSFPVRIKTKAKGAAILDYAGCLQMVSETQGKKLPVYVKKPNIR